MPDFLCAHGTIVLESDDCPDCVREEQADATARHLRADLASAERRRLDAEMAGANWRWLYERTREDLIALRQSWTTCRALKCCSCLEPPHDVEIIHGR